MSGHGWLRLGLLYVQGKPVAAQIWSVVHARASIFRLAYDETWKPYSPGSILTHYMMQHVIEVDQATEIDFLTGNDRYKQDWMSQRRQRWRLVCIKKRKSGDRLKQLIASFKRLLRL